MHENQRETLVSNFVRLPVTMTKHPAPVSGINLNRLGNGRKPERGAGKIIPDNGLQMAVGEPAGRRKSSEPGRRTGRIHALVYNRYWWVGELGGHECLIGDGLARESAELGRPVGIEQKTGYHKCIDAIFAVHRCTLRAGVGPKCDSMKMVKYFGRPVHRIDILSFG